MDIIDVESNDELNSDSSDSQALAVNHAHETLVRLRKGDFDSILAGRPRTKTRSRPAARSVRKRPRLRQRRLDEETLFARPTPRAKPEPHWEEQRFSVDFDLVPLPSNLTTEQSFVRHVHSLLSFLDTLEAPPPEPCDVAGALLLPQMSVDEFLTLLPALNISTSVLHFISAYISLLSVVDVARVQEPLRTLLDHAPTTLMDRWWTLDIFCRLQRLLPNEANTASLSRTSIALLGFLLSIGFDKAVRPLRLVLRRESLTAQIDDELTIAWIAIINVFDREPDWTTNLLIPALDQTFGGKGPMAAERVWFLAFGLSALSQFDSHGQTHASYTAKPRWALVRHACSLITVSDEPHSPAELLRGRDRYIRTMMARCLRLSSLWKWSFDSSTFSLITRDLGAIFKIRQHRNLPSEPNVDFPRWITNFDIAQTADSPARSEVAFDLYIKLICLAASDMISQASSLQEAKSTERDIRRLTMTTIPLTAATHGAVQLINRYTMLVVACYFSPDLIVWSTRASLSWCDFASADLQSRQVTIRGLMYLAVACRHHDQSIQPIIDRLASILQNLNTEVASPIANRTIVLVIACFRQIISHHSFDPAASPIFPDPILLDNSECSRQPS